MSLLFLDACPRERSVSRTYRLCEAFLDAYRDKHPDHTIQELRLSELDLKPYDGEMVKRRDALIDASRTDGPMFELARQFQAADLILIGAPYWDLMFPASLKLYIEHIFARTITFVYTPEGEPVGLCAAKRIVYITTAGSPIGLNNWGGLYIKGVGELLGIKNMDFLSAEGLDIETNDAEAILREAEVQVRQKAGML